LGSLDTDKAGGKAINSGLNLRGTVTDGDADWSFRCEQNQLAHEARQGSFGEDQGNQSLVMLAAETLGESGSEDNKSLTQLAPFISTSQT
jgi:hypothetical protein